MKRFLALLVLIALLITSLLSFPLMSQAAAGTTNFDVSEIFSIPGDEDGKQSFDLTNQLIEEGKEAGSPAAAILLRVINILTLLLGTFGVIMLIISGYMFATADGDESRLDRAKAVISQTILGMVLGFGAYYIVTLVTSFLF
jgi:hypothetical protein